VHSLAIPALETTLCAGIWEIRLIFRSSRRQRQFELSLAQIFWQDKRELS